MRPDSKFLTLEELSSQPVDAHRPIILVNSKNADRKTPSPVLLAPKEPEKSTERLGKKSNKDLKSKSKIMREREEQKQKEEEAALSEASAAQQEEVPAWQPPTDEVLHGYIEEVRNNIQPLNSNRDQIEALARFVSGKMGGPVHRDSLSTFSYELPIGQLKVELNSNIIPIGKIQTGIFYHRALLFKALADRIAVSCSLVRGEYNRAWNEVMLCEDAKDGQPTFPPKSYIVDLMHAPGRLMSTDSPDASLYQRL